MWIWRLLARFGVQVFPEHWRNDRDRKRSGAWVAEHAGSGPLKINRVEVTELRPLARAIADLPGTLDVGEAIQSYRRAG